MEIFDRRWEEGDFFEQRRSALGEWPTGRDVNLEEAVSYQRSLPPHKVQAHQLARAKADGNIVCLPQVGQATIEKMLSIFDFVEGECGMSDWNDSWFIILDAYSRKKRFDAAAKAIEASKAAGANLLSGFPAVNHGVAGFRKLIEYSGHSGYLSTLDEDPRLCSEISFAGGGTGYLAYDIHDLMQHSRDYPLDRRIHNFQYVSRLAAYYTEKGAPITAWPAGHHNGWEPPGVKISMVILQVLEAARQGVKHMACSYGLTGNLTQDVVGLRLMGQMVTEYFAKFGFDDVNVYFGAYPHLGTWPTDILQATAMMAWETSVTRMAGAQFIYLKSPDEASSTPSMEAIGAEVKIAKHMLNVLGNFKIGDTAEMAEEQGMVEAEVRAVVDATLDLSHGDVSNGMILGVEKGFLDAVFSPWIHVKNRLLTVRDLDGAYRYLDFGSMPVPKAVTDYHRKKIEQRCRATGKKADIEMVTEDLYHLARPIGSFTFSKLV